MALCLLINWAAPLGFAQAQDIEPEGPIYIVQEGDSLWSIAVRFQVTVTELSQANNITDPGQLVVGARLILPGLRNIKGILTTRAVSFGETLRSLSRRYQASIDALITLNHLASPTEIYAGATLVIPEPDEAAQPTKRAMLLPGQSMLELALLNQTNPWSIALSNQLANPNQAAAGEVLHIKTDHPTEESANAPGALPETIHGLSIKPAMFYQGRVGVIHVESPSDLGLSGSLTEHIIQFFPDGKSGYTGLQGIHALQDPGLYTMVLSGTIEQPPPYETTSFSFSQSVLVRRGDYPFDPVLIVSPETIDPAVTKPEDAQWNALAAPATPQKLWQGQFQSPMAPPFSDCWPSLFGNRRSYNGSEYKYFHTGLDFCGGVGIEILAPAAGIVVFAGPLTVRGNATMIDHGWGIYTGYMHQSELLVEVGDRVEPGQVIGLVGGTGRVTGPHLHWEIWAGGIQVDPMDWLEQAFP
jgi:murein DD-endopeptidase MepM/ murein hydrolase activator NlpD